MANRNLCNVLDEVRMQYKTRNFSGLLGLIEEAQTMGNRMEAALHDQKDFKTMEKTHRELKAKLRKSKSALDTATSLAEEQGMDKLKDDLEKLASASIHYDSW